MSTAIAVCETCGMPVRVDLDPSGNVVEVFSVCGHIPATPTEGDTGGGE